MIINSDKMPYFLIFEDDFNGEELKPTASKEAILAYVNFKIDCTADKDILLDDEKLGLFGIDILKETDCYKSKTDKEKAELCEYIKENVYQERIALDEHGNKIFIN